MILRLLLAYSFLLLRSRTDAFVLPSHPTRTLSKTTTTSLNSLWRHWIPTSDVWGFDDKITSLKEHDDNDDDNDDGKEGVTVSDSAAKSMFLASLLTAVLSIAPQTVMAVSGGGLDFAGLDISGQDFSNNNYKGKDFTQVLAKGTSFAKSNLQGCRFYKAYLVNADFTDADIRGVSMEDTSMDNASLKNAIAAGSYFSVSILDTKSVENADFTDAQFPVKALPLLCDREDLKGTNPVTGVDTRDSVMCP